MGLAYFMADCELAAFDESFVDNIGDTDAKTCMCALPPDRGSACTSQCVDASNVDCMIGLFCLAA